MGIDPRRGWRWLGLWLVLSLGCGGSLGSARAGIIEAPASALQVALITYGPGETYWERFGHDAIEIRDTVSGQDITFNYGVFDFDEKGFFLNFARGRMRYMIDAEPFADDNQGYIDAGRSIQRQVLALSPAETEHLRQFLLWNLRPEHVRYPYDYYQSNCATRVRDALNLALDGALERQLTRRPGGYSFRQQTDRLMAAQPWLMLLLDLGLGPFADQPLNAWQASFLPEVLAAQVADLRLADGRPLVSQTELLAPNRLTAPALSPPPLFWPLLLAGLAYAAALLLLRTRSRLGLRLLASVFLLAAGIEGSVLALLWLATTHYAAWYNANLLLFNPLAWLWLRPLWRTASTDRGWRWLSGLQGLALVIGLGLYLSGVSSQHNAAWLGFAIPIWLALGLCLRPSRNKTRAT